MIWKTLMAHRLDASPTFLECLGCFMVVAYVFCSAFFLSSCGDLSSCLLQSIQRIGVRRAFPSIRRVASVQLILPLTAHRCVVGPLRAHHFLWCALFFSDLTLELTCFRSVVGKNDLPKWSKGFRRKSYGWRSFRVKHQSSWFLAAASSSGPRITRAPCAKRTGYLVPRAEKFGDLITAAHQVSQ